MEKLASFTAAQPGQVLKALNGVVRIAKPAVECGCTYCGVGHYVEKTKSVRQANDLVRAADLLIKEHGAWTSGDWCKCCGEYAMHYTKSGLVLEEVAA